MRVKKLELCGFKSFPTKTTVHFEPGVTAIVGPNGSGKSNVVDSIRWVLGEHNPRDVRAPRLEDVIFNGTDAKAPLSMAEVQLTIANEQGLLPISFTEVTIARRVYRSGESECFINQAPCRLKDIQELFLGTGLGGGTYAIIEQGHIDMVLSSKPEERRVVFEEASGIAKYLAKKEETMRRLTEVEDHLVRVADIVAEVRRQVNALERQAAKARQYQRQWEQLKTLELRLAVDELSTGETRGGELEDQLKALTAQRETLEAATQEYLAALEACNASVSTIQGELQELRTMASGCAANVREHENQAALKQRWVEELTRQAEQLAQETEQLSTRFGQLDEQLARVSGGETELTAQLAAIEGRIGQGSDELATLEATIQGVLATISAAKQGLFDVASAASQARNQVAELTAQLQGLQAQAERLAGRAAERDAHQEHARTRRETALRERETITTHHEALAQRLRATQEQLHTAQNRRHELMGRVHQVREQLASERARVQLLEELWRRYEGFPETIKVLMDRSVDGLIGPLVDVLQPVSGYEAVVEAALGPLADALVVRDRASLERCRAVLTEHQLEGARFLVLSDCPSETALVGEPPAAGLVGAVRQYVRAEPAYQRLVDWLLNDSWMVDDLRPLLAGTALPEARLVSQQGERWDRRSWRLRGAMDAAGGPAPPPAGRFGRKPRWEHATAALQAHEQEFARLEAGAAQAEREWQEQLGQQESLNGQLAHLAPTLHQLDAQAAQLTRDMQRLADERAADELDIQELSARQSELQQALAAAQHAAQEAQAQQDAMERSLGEAQASRDSAERRRQQLVIAKVQVEAAMQSLQERCDALAARRGEIEADRAALTQQLEGKHTQREASLTRGAELSAQLEAHASAREQLQTEQATRLAEVERVTRTLSEAEARRNEVLPRLLAVEQQLSGLTQQIQERSSRLSERSFRRERIVERLRELYHIDETALEASLAANAPPLTEEQRADMTAQVQTLRTKLEGMGPVSLGSVEEHEELTRRLEFLQTQQRDLLQARDDLKASIAQINRTARAQFRETFQRITTEFQHYYTRLFNGGQADLLLLDEDDVLECGIDIVARPPGKRLQSISLLSGGERALTAIALLFALFKVRPSPFCILDEIDAPLDEANVGRFTRVLEEFLALSQFILITHNKSTITKADSLYGVTMEEPGISKILSAKLTKPQPAAPSPQPAATPA